ncbi:MAG: AAA family ATPase [Balneolaceae bacterium]
MMNGEMLWEYGGGEQTNKFLKRMGFQVMEKGDNHGMGDEELSIQQMMIERYKDLIQEDGNEEELFKWRLIRDFHEKWNINAEDFAGMVGDLDFSNLLDYRSLTFVKFIGDYPEEARVLFRELFDEGKDLDDRIETFGSESEKLLRKHHPDLGAFQDERTMATYLTFRYPDKYTFYKYSFYTKYTNLLQIKRPKAGQRYSHYLKLVDAFIQEYISQDEDLIRLSRETLTEDSFVDTRFNILAQDIFYRAIDERKVPERDVDDFKTVLESLNEEDATRFFQVMDELVDFLDLSEMDPRVVYSVRPQLKRLVFTIGQRYVFLCQLNNETLWGFIHPSNTIGQNKGKPFKGGPESYFYFMDDFSCVASNSAEIKRASLVELGRTDRSGYLKFTNDTFQRVVFDQEYRSMLFREVFGRVYQGESTNGVAAPVRSIETYSIDGALEEVFMEEEELRAVVDLLQYKKNIILQGPPGTGKTFLAKRLAWLLSGRKDSARVDMVQFHPSYSYEDFIRGYRPTDSHFELKDGLFLEICRSAIEDPDHPYVLIIDEINRGNLSKIFGELMLLIESDKRGEEFTVKLPYRKSPDEPDFFIPENLYLIGTMNTADRSLAIVDYALRRRFVFIDVMPEFGSSFQEYLQKKEVPDFVIGLIVEKLESLNETIRKESGLGAGFQVGHSYFCHPQAGNDSWYENIIHYEIVPLLEEYWFDKREKVRGLEEKLLKS